MILLTLASCPPPPGHLEGSEKRRGDVKRVKKERRQVRKKEMTVKEIKKGRGRKGLI